MSRHVFWIPAFLLRSLDFGVERLLMRFAGFGVVGDAFAFDDLAEAGVGAVLPGDGGAAFALEVHDRQAGHFDALADLLSVGDGFGLVEESLGLSDELVREKFVVVLKPEVNVGVGREATDGAGRSRRARIGRHDRSSRT